MPKTPSSSTTTNASCWAVSEAKLLRFCYRADSFGSSKCRAKKKDGSSSTHGKAPTDVAKVAEYKIEQRQPPEGPWTDAAMAMDTEATLHGQARGKEWEYRVIAINKAGEGEPSNTVMALI
jgi:hypothetical protein